VKPILIIAGETSGDLHAANLVREMKLLKPELQFFGIGGDKMKAVEVELLAHIKDLNFMGFIEPLKHLPFINKIMKLVLSEVVRRKVELAILVDYPGFNLRLAEKLKSLKNSPQSKIFYYISPQVWAWGKGRIPKIARLIDRMVGILHFELETYRNTGLDFHFVGHPLLDEMVSFEEKKDFFKRYSLDPNLSLIGLLPGSRNQEVRRMLPVMLKATHLIERQFTAQYVIGASEAVDPALYRNVFPASVIFGDTRNLMKHSNLVIVASGTASLETAIAGTPMIVIYRMNPLSFQIGKLVVNLRNIALVNVVAGGKIVPELIQNNTTPENIAREALRILLNPQVQTEQRENLALVRGKLGESGASRRAAKLAIELVQGLLTPNP
jgi:lipid-A-disaccharide synthase